MYFLLFPKTFNALSKAPRSLLHAITLQLTLCPSDCAGTKKVVGEAHLLLQLYSHGYSKWPPNVMSSVCSVQLCLLKLHKWASTQACAMCMGGFPRCAAKGLT